jgi:hypothetical protein
MMKRLSMLGMLLVLVAAMAMVGCEGDTGPEGAQGPVGPTPDGGDLGCADCHNSTNIITGKMTEWDESGHGMNESYVRGTSSSCAFCHSGGGFVMATANGQNPGEVTEGDPDPTRQDCRTCHNIHTTYTGADFSLRTMDPVDLYEVPGMTYDGGMGNLCANCHQPRRLISEAVNDTISGISSHWGPHHGPQSAMLLGVAGAGVPDGVPHAHYRGVENTCVGCHMYGENHTFEPNVKACQKCHDPDQSDFDVDGVQTAVSNMVDQLGERLLAYGLINENSPDGHPTVSKAQTEQAMALWNWLYVAHEDKSMGVHNPDYAIALLSYSLSILPAP